MRRLFGVFRSLLVVVSVLYLFVPGVSARGSNGYAVAGRPKSESAAGFISTSMSTSGLGDGTADAREAHFQINRSSNGCTLVQLYPGYPLYRGVITGMLANWGGLGDYACVEDLERRDPMFDQRDEDRANRAAAREIGISGEPEDWTWENWMQIEAVRGLPPQCYSCVLFSSEIVPLTTSVQPDPRDPRILAGLLGDTSAIYSATVGSGANYGMAVNRWEDNYLLRAAAYLWNGQPYNAPELLQMYEDIFLEESTPGGASLNYEICQQIVVEVGGYTWVPDDAWAEDQEFLATVAWYAGSMNLPPPIRTAAINQLNSMIAEWKGSGQRVSLREYMQLNYSFSSSSEKRNLLHHEMNPIGARIEEF
jgi:hypothetical protein